MFFLLHYNKMWLIVEFFIRIIKKPQLSLRLFCNFAKL